MTESITFYPPYSIVVISDEDLPSSPYPEDRFVTANDEVALIRCMPEPEGETTITLLHSLDITKSDDPKFDGVIATPRRRIVVSTSDLEIVLSAKVSSDRTRVQIWATDPTLPDDILIGFEEA